MNMNFDVDMSCSKCNTALTFSQDRAGNVAVEPCANCIKEAKVQGRQDCESEHEA